MNTPVLAMVVVLLFLLFFKVPVFAWARLRFILF